MNVTEPTPDQEAHDQEEFDAAVNRDGKLVLAWLGGIGVVVALLLSILALTKSADRNTVTITSGVAAPATSSTPSGTAGTLPARRSASR